MSTSSAGPTFALVGAAGYIARRHMEAIRDIGGTLTACHDIADSVGILDSYFPGARFFTYGREFEDHLSYHRPDYLVVCTPNDLHKAHAALGVRLGCDLPGVDQRLRNPPLAQRTKHRRGFHEVRPGTKHMRNQSVHSCPYYYESGRRTSSQPGASPATGRENTS